MRLLRAMMSTGWSVPAECEIGRRPQSKNVAAISENLRRAGKRSTSAEADSQTGRLPADRLGPGAGTLGVDVNPRWKRDPNFYLEQTLTPIAEALTVPGPYDEARSREILTRVENVPSILQQGTENLKKPPAPFATVAMQALEGVHERLQKMATALRPVDHAQARRN